MSQKKPSNVVIISLGKIHRCSADPCIREFTVKIYNTIDLLPGMDGGSRIADGVPGYLSNTVLEETLENLRESIRIMWHSPRVDQVLKEENSI